MFSISKLLKRETLALIPNKVENLLSRVISRTLFNPEKTDTLLNLDTTVNPKDHYNIPIADRFDLEEILDLIHQKKYFILHAPRQTGKTSAMLTLMIKHGG